ncbi:MAG: hypothetical protein ACI4WG_00685 [Erysipelotrichaceae bacterium]
MLLKIIAVIALLLTLFVVVVITPSNKDGKLNKFFQAVHDFFNFKKMYLTLVIKFVYIFLNFFAVLVGIRLLFGVKYYGHYVSTFWHGLFLIVVSPLLLRLIYEFILLIITAAQSIIQIRDKMLKKETEKLNDDFDKALNATEDFSEKVINKAKELSQDALQAAGNKIDEMKQAKKQDDETGQKPEENNQQ